MELSVSHQLFVVTCMFLCGGLTGVIFDCFRGFRRCVKSTSGIIAAQDLFLWAAELIVVYYTAFKVNNAAIRGYEAVALILGAVIYFVTLSEYTVKGVCAATGFVLKFSDALLFPFRKMAEFIMKILKKITLKFEKRLSLVKNKVKVFVFAKISKTKDLLRIKKHKK